MLLLLLLLLPFLLVLLPLPPWWSGGRGQVRIKNSLVCSLFQRTYAGQRTITRGYVQNYAEILSPARAVVDFDMMSTTPSGGIIDQFGRRRCTVAHLTWHCEVCDKAWVVVAAGGARECEAISMWNTDLGKHSRQATGSR